KLAIILTVHPLKEEQKQRRIASGEIGDWRLEIGDS
ncbi:unnamed protein product, partial [marine sediment metagenome]